MIVERFRLMIPGRAQSVLAAGLVLVLVAAMMVACGGEDDDVADRPGESSGEAATEDGPAGATEDDEDEAADEAGRGGEIEIGEESWTLVPSIQCGIFGGEVVSIAGHAAEDESIEIVIDFDETTDLVQTTVSGPDGAPRWASVEDTLSFRIDGKTVSGTGAFIDSATAETAQGGFEVTC